jgi:hypothetical protein
LYIVQHWQPSGEQPVIDQFSFSVQVLSVAYIPKEKMILINRPIHGVH